MPPSILIMCACHKVDMTPKQYLDVCSCCWPASGAICNQYMVHNYLVFSDWSIFDTNDIDGHSVADESKKYIGEHGSKHGALIPIVQFMNLILKLNVHMVRHDSYLVD